MKSAKATQPQTMLRALCDLTRLRILALLMHGELCVGDLVSIINVPQPTASRHLSYLRRAGLVSTRKTSQWIFYALKGSTSDLHASIIGCVAASAKSIPELQLDRARAEKLKDKGGCCPS